MVKTGACFLLLVAAMIVSGFVPREQRRSAVSCSLVLCAIWLAYVSSWFPPYCPASALWYGFGIDASHVEMWALADALGGVAIVAIAGERWWGVTLAGTLSAQGMAHILAEANVLTANAYLPTLDALFLAQLAVLFYIGGRGAKEHVRDCLLRGGRSFSGGAYKASPASEKK